MTVILLGVLLIPVVAGYGEVTLNVDAGATIGPWNRFYEHSIGTSHANTWRTSVYGRSIERACQIGREQAGFRWVRGHGSLNDHLEVYHEDAQGNPYYDWTKFDEVFDAMYRAGVRPICEFSFMPTPLASGPESIFWYAGLPGNTTPPYDHNKWRDMIRELVLHVEQRYGVEEVRNNWFFELWNEADLGWLKGGLDPYIRLYDYTSAGVEDADPLVMLGGPATSSWGSWGEWIEVLIDHCNFEVNEATGQVGSKLDFITYHMYPWDTPRLGFPEGPAGMLGFHNHVMQKIDGRGFTGPVIVTEWATGHRDPESSGTFMLKTTHLLMDNTEHRAPDGMCWWTISDIFEEWDARPYTAFSDDFGLMLRGDPNIPDSYDVPKSIFNVYRLCHMMTDERLPLSGGATGDGIAGLATVAADDSSVEILVYKHITGGGADPNQGELTHVTVNNLPFRTDREVLVEHFAVDVNHSNCYRTWQNQGSPVAPNATQWAQLKQDSELDYFDAPANVLLPGRTFSKSFDVKNYGTYLIRLYQDPVPAPSDLAATPMPGPVIELTWTDNASGDEQEDGFIIQRKRNSPGQDWQQIELLPADSTSYSDTTPYGILEYVYRVGAFVN